MSVESPRPVEPKSDSLDRLMKKHELIPVPRFSAEVLTISEGPEPADIILIPSDLNPHNPLLGRFILKHDRSITLDEVISRANKPKPHSNKPLKLIHEDITMEEEIGSLTEEGAARQDWSTRFYTKDKRMYVFIIDQKQRSKIVRAYQVNPGRGLNAQEYFDNWNPNPDAYKALEQEYAEKDGNSFP